MSTTDELQGLMRKYRTCAEKVDQLTAERDRLIRQALDERTPRAKIIAITELSPARIDQIRRSARQ